MRSAQILVTGVVALLAAPVYAHPAKRHPLTVASAATTAPQGKQDVEIEIADSSDSPQRAVAPGLENEAVDRVVKAHLPLLEPCYQRDPLLAPLSGAVTVKFEVQPDGRVSRTKVLRSTVGDEAVSRCVAERFKMFRFPSPGAAAVILSYPVLIASAGG